MKNDPLSRLSNRLESEGEKTLAFFSSLDAELWQSEVYTEDSTWTIRDVLAHFVTAERGFLRLFESICQGGSGVPEDFSIDAFNTNQQKVTKALSPQELVKEFRKARSEMCTWVAGSSSEDLEREGRHPFLGQVSVFEMVKMVYLHNQIHIRDIRKSIY